MPKYERSFERHKCSLVTQDEAWRVVSSGATCRNGRTVGERVRCFHFAIITIHTMHDWSLVAIRLCVEFNRYSARIDISKKNLN